MNISEIFIRRPVMTTLVMFAILLFGAMGYKSLPINALPNVDFPTLVVTASLPGASPATMASSVATPLEKQFSTIAGIVAMNSSSSLGATQITLQFDLSRNIDAAAQDVQSAITSAGRLLPPNLPSPPSYQKVNPSNQPVLYLALRSDTLPLYTVDEYAETYVAQHVSMVNGVAQVVVLGQQKYAVRAQMDPKALAERGVGLDQVAAAMAANNVKLATGTLYGTYLAYNVETNDQLENASQYKQMIVGYRNGSPIRLSDVANVIDSVQDDKIAGWEGSQRAVVLAVQRQPGTNTVQVVADVRKALQDITKKIPASAHVDVLYDLSDSIKASVDDVEYTLLLTIGLVVAIILLFLGNASATLIASVALPMSIVGTFAAMSLLGFSLNNLTLMALTLATGFVVDDAIVMLENIVRHMEMGEEFFQAALNGSREIGFTILSMTLSLVAVFIPVLLMGGIVGRLFKEFSVTISVSILVSGFISLSLTPMLCSRILKPNARPHEGNGEPKKFKSFFDYWLRAYDVTLRFVLRYRAITLLVSFVLLGVTAFLFVITPKGFMPTEDTGQLIGYTEGSQSISYDDMVRHQQALAAIVKNDANVESYVSSVGTGGADATGNEGAIQVYLKPRAQRALSADQVIAELRPKLDTVPGIRVYLQNPPTISIGGQVTKSLYQITLEGTDPNLLHQVAPQLERALEQLPQIQDVATDMAISAPQANVTVDRDKASLLGLNANAVDTALGDAYGVKQVSTIYESINEYWVILEVMPKYYSSPNLLDLLYIHSANGKLVPLSTVSKVTISSAPLLVNHLGQLPSATISFNLAPGVSLGSAMDAVDKVAAKIVPSQLSYGFQGTAQSFQSSFQGLWGLLVLAILVIYIVLGILYESFIHPLTILAGLPSAGLGALVTLLIFHKELDVYSFLGLIMLVGIVKKNAIMMIDFALEEERERGKSSEESIYSACLVRFRPIMMTTMAALMGSIPIAAGWGAGAESRQPLGLAVVGGLLVSQFITLYLTPVVYIYLDNLSHWFTKKPSTAGGHH
ncbi:MAG TPA: efflux RND transporter permease subunit [Candidatus Xenobia bacterium]|jgi:HAE1 family hydrophobic/amphiphilic exporter-1